MNKSESIKNLSVALKKAQSEMGEVGFDSNNPFFKSRYASLGAVINASKKALADNGLSISQPATANEYGVGITTVLMHDSGEWLESSVTVPLPEPTYTDKNGEIKQNNYSQEAGKIITYLRRYSLASILNLYSDEDTDGEQKRQPAKSAPSSAEVVEEKPKPKPTPKVERPYPPEILREKIETLSKKFIGKPASKEQSGLMVGMLETCYAGNGADLKRHEASKYLTGEASSKNMKPEFVLALLDWLKPTKINDTGEYMPDGMAIREAQAIITARLEEAGQEKLI